MGWVFEDEKSSVERRLEAGNRELKAIIDDLHSKGNADTERFIRTMKEELLWLNGWELVSQLNAALKEWIRHYNHHYLHSSLGYQAPAQFEEQYFRKQLKAGGLS